MQDLAAAPDQVSREAVAERSAQGIVCGAWAMAFEFGWARSIVESFELVAVPQAPSWLVGAISLEGDVLCAVDLSRFVGRIDAPFVQKPEHKLLIGGQGQSAMALVFSHRPQMLRFTPNDGEGLMAAPAAIRSAVRGIASNDKHESYLDIDGHKLVQLLASLVD